MGIIEIILIGIGLSMDAFAVSITLGLSAKKISLKTLLLPGLYFGVFQALMPAIGYFLGTYFSDKIQSFDHWIAFVLLGSIGAKMIKDSFAKDEEQPTGDSFGFIKMLVLAFATSIDALAVGITFAFFKVDILKAIIIIGSITFFLSICGVKIGSIFGTKFKSKAEFVGGTILVALGIKIVVEHLFFN
jgi:putative Mn2+ efflux pump MntP